MLFSEECIKILNRPGIPLMQSNILISDLKHIVYGVIEKRCEFCLDYNKYYQQSLSKDMIDLEDEWMQKKYDKNLLLILNNNFKQIIANDSTPYSAQMFFPLFKNQKLDGFAIFFRINGTYINSSSKAPRTIINFIQDELDKNI